MLRWLIDLFKLGLQRPLSAHDVYKNLNANDAAKLTEKFNTAWETELAHSAKRKPHIFNVIWKVCISKIIGFSFLYSTIDIFLRWVEIAYFVVVFFLIEFSNETFVHNYTGLPNANVQAA